MAANVNQLTMFGIIFCSSLGALHAAARSFDAWVDADKALKIFQGILAIAVTWLILRVCRILFLGIIPQVAAQLGGMVVTLGGYLQDWEVAIGAFLRNLEIAIGDYLHDLGVTVGGHLHFFVDWVLGRFIVLLLPLRDAGVAFLRISATYIDRTLTWILEVLAVRLYLSSSTAGCSYHQTPRPLSSTSTWRSTTFLT